MKGLAVQIEGGAYIFAPAYDPMKDDKVVAIPLNSNEYFLAGSNQSVATAANDKGRAIPTTDGLYLIEDRCKALPITVTTGASEYSVAAGYSGSFRNIQFYWDGTGTIYLSSSGTSPSDITINDGITVTTGRGALTRSGNPTFSGTVQISGIDGGQGKGNIIQKGINVVKISLKNNYGTTLGYSAIYIIKA